MKLHCDIGFHIHRGVGEDKPKIEIIDRISGCVVLVVEMTMEDYSKGILTNINSVPCVIELNTQGNVGKKIEHKNITVWIPNPKKRSEQIENAKKYLQEYETDGWHGNHTDATNYYSWATKDPPKGSNSSDGHWHNVGFHRWVESTNEEREKVGERKY